jgi:branched-subunit amino acid ABC-type transport system permease component
MNGARVLQALINGVIAGSLIGALATTVALVLSVAHRFHIAYVATYVGGVYVAIWTQQQYGVSTALAAVIGLAAATLFGLLLEAGLYRPIAARAAGRGYDALIPVFVASLGVTIVLQNLVALRFNTQPIPFALMDPAGIHVGAVFFTDFNIITVAVSWLLVLGLAGFLRFTRRGRWVKGVRVDPELSAAVGINTGRVSLFVFAIASFAAGLFGMFESTNVAAAPTMGFDLIFLGFVVAFVAGPMSGPIRIALVGVCFGEASNITQLWLSPVWGTVVVFSILVGYLVSLSLGGSLTWLRRPAPASA